MTNFMIQFIYGILFVLIALPIINEIVTLVSQAIEYLYTCIAIKTEKKKMQLNVEIQQQEEEANKPYTSTNVIGFQVEPEYYYDEDDE